MYIWSSAGRIRTVFDHLSMAFPTVYEIHGQPSLISTYSNSVRRNCREMPHIVWICVLFMYCKYSQSTVIRKNLNVVWAVRSALSLRNGDTVGVVALRKIRSWSPIVNLMSLLYVYVQERERGGMCFVSGTPARPLLQTQGYGGRKDVQRSYICIQRNGWATTCEKHWNLSAVVWWWTPDLRGLHVTASFLLRSQSFSKWSSNLVQ